MPDQLVEEPLAGLGRGPGDDLAQRVEVERRIVRFSWHSGRLTAAEAWVNAPRGQEHYNDRPMTPQVAMLVFVLVVAAGSVVLWPRRGLLARAIRRFRSTVAVLADDALKVLYHHGPHDPEALGRALGLPPERTEAVLGRLMREGRITGVDGAIALTDVGRARALHVIRTHRLWERYLADRTGVGAADWHRQAERVEHRLSEAEADRLYASMGRPLFDPHGDPIPAPDGTVETLDGVSLPELSVGATAEVVHVEDEPPAPYARLVAAGIAAGQRVRVADADRERIVLAVEGGTVPIARGDAALVAVRPIEADRVRAVRSLAHLEIGETARVVGLAAACHGPQRRRLLDLGAVPGTPITAELAGPLGDPRVYRLRGAQIALRREQAAWVLVEERAS
jgi:DtxR family Mn-dependent transcriptional regulator